MKQIFLADNNTMKNRIIKYSIAFVLLNIIAICIVAIISIASQDKAASKVYENVKQQYNPSSEGTQRIDSFKDIKAINDDFVAWIKISDTNIDYPIVQTKDNQFYVGHSFDRSKNKSGSLFLDHRNAADFSDKVSIVYGHNNNNKTMFSELLRFADKDFLMRNKTIEIKTGEKDISCKVLSVFKTKSSSKAYRLSFSDNQQYRSHLDWLTNKSLVETQPNIDKIQKVILLSTCSNVTRDERFVVVLQII